MGNEIRIRQTLRAMAWERAKGELLSMLHTHYSEYNTRNRCDELDSAIKDFILNVENNALHE